MSEHQNHTVPVVLPRGLLRRHAFDVIDDIAAPVGGALLKGRPGRGDATGDDYLEAPEAAEALAAAEIGGCPERAAQRAESVGTRVVRNSELQELWDESKSRADWYAANEDLARRLTEGAERP